MAAGKNAHKPSRMRSPNYPAVSLKNAVERVERLYQKDGKAGAPLNVAVHHIGFGGAHGQAMAVLSALKKFGLVEDKSGRIVPTKLAIELCEFKEGHERNAAARRQSVMMPAIYSDLIREYAEHGRLPSDESLKPELTTDKGFNPKAVDGFIRDFRESLEFSGLLRDGTLCLSEDIQADPQSDEVQPPMPSATTVSPPESVKRATPPQATPLVPHGGPYISFPLPGGNLIEVRLRSKISSKEFETVKRLIELSEASLVEESCPGE